MTELEQKLNEFISIKRDIDEEVTDICKRWRKLMMRVEDVPPRSDRDGDDDFDGWSLELNGEEAVIVVYYGETINIESMCAKLPWKAIYNTEKFFRVFEEKINKEERDSNELQYRMRKQILEEQINKAQKELEQLEQEHK